MYKRFLSFLGILLLGVSFFVFPQEKELSLSLENCIVKAMENNLGVAIEVLNPELADIAVSRANEKFLPSLSFSIGRADQEQASYSWLDAADVLTTTYNEWSAQIAQEIPTGGNLSVELRSSVYDTNRTGITINPSYRSTLSFNFNQPLLKNFGFKTARKEIIVARNNAMISDENLESALQATIYSVEDAYWNLVFSIENLKVAQQSLKLAQDLLEKNKRAVEVGTMAPIDILTAQAEVASREAEILAAEAAVKNRDDRLKQILNISAIDKESQLLNIIPKDSPKSDKKEVKLEEALAVAMQNRPDLQAIRLGLKNSEIDVGYTKNQLLPELNLSISYWSPGVSGDLLIYDPTDPFGPPVQTVPGGRGDSFKDAFGFEYKNWSIGLTLNVPINNILSRAAYAQAKVNLDQAMLQLKNQEQQVFTDIKIAVRNVETTYKQTQSFKVARELAERQLEAEEEKLKVGLTTNFFVLQYQRDLANARSQELQAIVSYNLALAQLSRDLGVSLQEKNIKISDIGGR